MQDGYVPLQVREWVVQSIPIPLELPIILSECETLYLCITLQLHEDHDAQGEAPDVEAVALRYQIIKFLIYEAFLYLEVEEFCYALL